MPITISAFTIAGFGLIGVPGTAGFISKWYLGVGALDNDSWLLLLLVVASSFISVIYVGRVLEVLWFREPATRAVIASSEPPWSMLLPLIALAVAVVYFGIDTRMTAGIAGTAAHTLIGDLLQ